MNGDVMNNLLSDIERIVHVHFSVTARIAVANVCAWPNLTMLPNGEVLTAIYNQPSHGMWEGDLEAWVSNDQGETWSRRSTIAEHDRPGIQRSNCSVGFAHNQDLVALCGGWANRSKKRSKSQPFREEDRMPVHLFRSSDHGHNWHRKSEMPRSPDGELGTPFGDIVRAGDQRLATTMYAHRPDDSTAVWLVESDDDGHTWRWTSMINELGNETVILPVDDSRWIAASREEHDTHLEQFDSDDGGKTWRRIGPLTLPWQVTGHLTRLRDGDILLSYGNRCPNNYGVDARFSRDGGATWSAPLRIMDNPMRDSGYPSTVELDDGRLLTACYTQLPGEYQYEMRVATWSVDHTQLYAFA